MGLILPQTIKIRTNASNYKHYKEKGYTFKKCGDFIEVNILDLPKGSHEMVKVVCDICKKEREMWYSAVAKCNEENKLITCGSDSCKHKKYEDTCMKKYGVKNPNQVQEVQNKKKATNLERYGCESVMQNEKIKNKMKATNLERYGCICSLQSEEIKKKTKKTWQEKYGQNVTSPFQVESVKNKIKETNLKRYGYECTFGSKEIQNKSKKTMQEKYGQNIISPLQVESIKNKMKETNLERYGTQNPFGSKEIQDKIKATNLERYGVEHVLQNEEIRDRMKETMMKNYGVEYPLQNRELLNKALDSFQFNGTGPSSRAQRYINYILNGTLNKHICGSLADIYMEKENIIIEYDGSGHFLRDIINGNKTPTKESSLYEKRREDKIINSGYRMIRFIATKDRIPSDEVILNLIEGFKNSDFKVIRINFEEGTIDRDYYEKWYCNFGELRNITQKDLEQFKK